MVSSPPAAELRVPPNRSLCQPKRAL
jgi:hypothetical protein